MTVTFLEMALARAETRNGLLWQQIAVSVNKRTSLALDYSWLQSPRGHDRPTLRPVQRYHGSHMHVTTALFWPVTQRVVVIPYTRFVLIA